MQMTVETLREDMETFQEHILADDEDEDETDVFDANGQLHVRWGRYSWWLLVKWITRFTGCCRQNKHHFVDSSRLPCLGAGKDRWIVGEVYNVIRGRECG